jgi:transcriptional regulator with XRE-family HTH domain
MDVSTPVPSLGWTRRNAAASVLLALDVQRREVGRRVAKLLEDRSWTHEDLAHHASISVKTVSRVVNGRHEARNDTITRIAKALDVDKDDLWPKTLPLGLGVEDPYQEQMERIEAMLAHLVEQSDPGWLEANLPSVPLTEAAEAMQEAGKRAESDAPRRPPAKAATRKASR